jgi:hypothetical protein
MNPRYPAYISYLHYTNEPSTPKPIPPKIISNVIPKSKALAHVNWNDFFKEPTQTFKESVPEKVIQKPAEIEIVIARPERMLPDNW